MLKNHSIFRKINKLGTEKIPFFFMIDYLKENGIVTPLSELPDYIKFEINGKYKPISKSFRFEKHPITFEDYLEKYNLVHKNLMLGNSYLVNLTYTTKIETDLSLEEIYQYSNAKYKLKYRDDFVCFSPETFVKIKNCQIFSNPMKGTIDSSILDAKELIMNDEKEKSEHATIVDLIRNDLSIVAENVTVSNYRYIDEIKTKDKILLQVSSEIRGDLQKNFNQRIGNILENLLPAGSICGAPKEKTIDIILEAEKYSRNFYTGIFGVFDGYSVDSAVMIRFIEKQDNQLFFKSGGGITAKSNAKNEYNELIQKVYVPIY